MNASRTQQMRENGKFKAWPCAVVIAPPGHYRNSLMALLITLARFERVLAFNDLHQAQAEMDAEPILTVIEFDASSQPRPKDINQLRQLWPRTRLLLMSDHDELNHSTGEYQVDSRVFRNISTGEFFHLVERLLASNPVAAIPSSLYDFSHPAPTQRTGFPLA